jgi:hypothetical protein
MFCWQGLLSFYGLPSSTISSDLEIPSQQKISTEHIKSHGVQYELHTLPVWVLDQNIVIEFLRASIRTFIFFLSFLGSLKKCHIIDQVFLSKCCDHEKVEGDGAADGDTLTVFVDVRTNARESATVPIPVQEAVSKWQIARKAHDDRTAKALQKTIQKAGYK